VGKNNRQRRANKQRDRDRRAPMGPLDPRPPGPARGRDQREIVESLVLDAAQLAERGDRDNLNLLVEALSAFAVGDGAMVVEMALHGRLIRALRGAWERGWQPADIVRGARKRLGGAHADLAGVLITIEARTSTGSGVTVPDLWAAQLRQVADGDPGEPRWTDLDVLLTGVEVLGLLLHLPVLPCLLAPPSAWGRGRPHAVNRIPGSSPDGRMLAKVRALLAKAESTDFEEEANALTAKAQELMARHAIDQAMVAGSAGDDEGGPGGRRIGVEDPYAVAKAHLLHSVARANRCRTVVMDGYGFSTVFGFPGDLDIVELLYTSLLVQATRAMTAAGSVRDGAGRSRTRSFRHSFLVAFAGRIGERLRAATTMATEEAAAVHGGSLLPVLAERAAEVEGAVAAAFPHLTSARVSASNRDGWIAGRVAADRAHLGPEQQLPPGVAV
jgi:hypothetical protein